MSYLRAVVCVGALQLLRMRMQPGVSAVVNVQYLYAARLHSFLLTACLEEVCFYYIRVRD